MVCSPARRFIQASFLEGGGDIQSATCRRKRERKSTAACFKAVPNSRTLPFSMRYQARSRWIGHSSGFSIAFSETWRPMADISLFASDTGQEHLYPGICRRHRRYNPVPNWGGGGFHNVPITRLVEDPIFLRSDGSLFIQLMDMIAYALLRKERPHPSGSDPYGIGTMFAAILGRIRVKEANSNDELGIIRVPYDTRK